MTQGYFAEAMTDEAQVERQQSTGRPLIKQPDGSVRAYTRASSLGDYLTDQEFLKEWEMIYLAIGLGRRPDLADQCAHEPYTTGFDEPPRLVKAESKRNVLSIIRRVLDAMKIHERADRGTVAHAITETGFDSYVPMVLVGEHAVFDAFINLNHIIRLGSEIFVVNDELRVAGTFDHLWYVPSLRSVVIGDTKNGRNKNSLGFGVQFAVYANSVVYNAETGERMTLEEYVAQKWEEIGMFAPVPPINRDVALLLSLKERQAKPSDVDIAWGYRMAKLAATVRDARDDTAGKVLQSELVQGVKGKMAQEITLAALAERIEAIEHAGELAILWRHHKDIWTPELTTRAAARKLTLEAS